MIYFRFLVSLVLASHWAPRALAADSAWVQHAEQRVSAELTTLVHGYDPDAIVLVRVGVASLKELDLPGTLFNIETATLSDSDGSISLKSISVQIIGKQNALTPEAKQLIQTIATINDVTPQVTYIATPKGFINPKDRPSEALPTDSSPGNKAGDKNETSKLSIGEQVRDVIKSSAGSLGSDIRQMLMISAVTVGIALFGLSVVVFALVGQAKKMVKSMVSKESSGNTSAASEPVQAQSRQRSRGEDGGTGAQNKSGGGESQGIIRDLPVETLVELLGDCYWCSHDAYASFLWNRISVENRKKIMTTSKILSAYVATLDNATEIDLGAHSEAVYMNGMTLSHLNNEVLAELVRKQPSLLSLLPRLRAESLPFSIVEWIELNKSEVNLTEKLPNFSSIAPSISRDIRVRHKFARISAQEEETILTLRGVDIELIKAVRSLAWIMSIESESLKEMLKNFSAQDLAEGLAAPQGAIDHVLAHLPDRKRDLTIGYMRSSSADRQSEIYSALYAAIVRQLTDAPAASDGNGDGAEAVEDSADENGGENVNVA